VAEDYHQKYNEKQIPRTILLVIAGICDVTPGLPQEAYKFGLGLVSDSLSSLIF